MKAGFFAGTGMGVGELLGDAGEQEAHAQGDDERLRLLVDGEESVHEADHDAEEDGQGDGKLHWHHVLELDGQDSRDDEDPPDGKVAAARDDGERDPEGEDEEDRGRVEHVEEVVGGVEVRAGEDHHDQHHDDGDECLLPHDERVYPRADSAIVILAPMPLPVIAVSSYTCLRLSSQIARIRIAPLVTTCR